MCKIPRGSNSNTPVPTWTSPSVSLATKKMVKIEGRRPPQSISTTNQIVGLACGSHLNSSNWQTPPTDIGPRPRQYSSGALTLEPIRAKPPKKNCFYRRVNHAELESPPWAKLCSILPPWVHLSVRYRSLGVKSLIRNFWEPGRYKENYQYFTSFFAVLIKNPSFGRGARISDKNSKGTFLWEPKRIEPIGRA